MVNNGERNFQQIAYFPKCLCLQVHRNLHNPRLAESLGIYRCIRCGLKNHVWMMQPAGRLFALDWGAFLARRKMPLWASCNRWSRTTLRFDCPDFYLFKHCCSTKAITRLDIDSGSTWGIIWINIRKVDSKLLPEDSKITLSSEDTAKTNLHPRPRNVLDLAAEQIGWNHVSFWFLLKHFRGNEALVSRGLLRES